MSVSCPLGKLYVVSKALTLGIKLGSGFKSQLKLIYIYFFISLLRSN